MEGLAGPIDPIHLLLSPSREIALLTLYRWRDGKVAMRFDAVKTLLCRFYCPNLLNNAEITTTSSVIILASSTLTAEPLDHYNHHRSLCQIRSKPTDPAPYCLKMASHASTSIDPSRRPHAPKLHHPLLLSISRPIAPSALIFSDSAESITKSCRFISSHRPSMP